MNGLKTGKKDLDKFLDITPGIIALQCLDRDWLAELTYSILVENYEPGQKMFYLQCFDYHDRYQSFKYDELVAKAIKSGVVADEFIEDVSCRRAFSRDAIESKAFWKTLLDLPPLSLILMDSITDLYSDDSQKTYSKPMLFSIGRFREWCQKNECFGVVLNASPYLHPYLGDSSAVVIRFELEKRLFAQVLKHPCFPETRIEVPIKAQRTLGVWA